MALDHAAGDGRLERQDVAWPGSGEDAAAAIVALADRWRALLDGLTEDELSDTARTRWPFRDRPFADVVAWVNVELAKNAAEIGYARFLYATGR